MIHRYWYLYAYLRCDGEVVLKEIPVIKENCFCSAADWRLGGRCHAVGCFKNEMHMPIVAILTLLNN